MLCIRLRRLLALFPVGAAPQAELTGAPAERTLRPDPRRDRALHQPGLLVVPAGGRASQDLRRASDVLALSLPVDYWDYLGWKDTFASPRNTERQRAYAKAFGIGPVYTPQAVINGTAQALGSSKNEIDEAIEQTAAAFRDAPRHRCASDASRTASSSRPAARPMAPRSRRRRSGSPSSRSREALPIKRGENNGKSLTYTNVVATSRRSDCGTASRLTIQLAQASIMRPETEDLIVLIQEANNGPIIGAAWLGQ